MKNNKGFSTLELIVSFSLTMIIVIVLFEIIIYMKELYEKSVTQTELVNRQNLLTDYIYTDLSNLDVASVSACGDNCLQFDFYNSDNKQLKWDLSYGTVSYENYTISLINNTNFDQTLSLPDYDGSELTGVKICNLSAGFSGSVDSYLSIKLPITNSLFPERDFGLNILYTYDSNVTTINLPTSNDC